MELASGYCRPETGGWVARVGVRLTLDWFLVVVGAVEPPAMVGGSEVVGGPPQLQIPMTRLLAGQDRCMGTSVDGWGGVGSTWTHQGGARQRSKRWHDLSVGRVDRAPLARLVCEWGRGGTGCGNQGGLPLVCGTNLRGGRAMRGAGQGVCRRCGAARGAWPVGPFPTHRDSAAYGPSELPMVCMVHHG
jgi:hypothetical protein